MRRVSRKTHEDLQTKAQIFAKDIGILIIVVVDNSHANDINIIGYLFSKKGPRIKPNPKFKSSPKGTKMMKDLNIDNYVIVKIVFGIIKMRRERE